MLLEICPDNFVLEAYYNPFRKYQLLRICDKKKKPLTNFYSFLQ